MTITCETFHAEHAMELGGDRPRADAYAAAGNAFTLRRDGRVIACAGLVETHEPGAAYIWSLTMRGLPLLSVHRATLRLLSLYSAVRVVAFTDPDNGRACRWLKLLGFARVIAADGSAVCRYERAAA